MRWDERRVAMLREMGIRLWWPARRDRPDSPDGSTPVVAEPVAPPPRVAASRHASVAPWPSGAAPVRPARPGPAPPGATASTRPGAVGPADSADAAAAEPAGLEGAAPAHPADPMAADPTSATPDPAGVGIPLTAPKLPLVLPAVAALDWPALRAMAAECTACALCAGRTRSVFGGTSARADWLVVGEPPVEAEDREGEPFVGKPGQLLDNLLRAVGVRRGDALAVPAQRACVTLPVKCRPPANRVPIPAEVDTCESYLARQIELVEPRIVLAMGRAASLLLRTDEPLGKLRGRVHRYRGLPLVATYAPAYLLRHPADKARAWEDLCLAVEALGATAEPKS